MEPTMRLLGVLVPTKSSQPVDMVEQANVLALSPFSAARRLQLDFPPDYGKENLATLENMAHERRIGFKTDITKAKLIQELQSSDDGDRRKHRSWLDEAAFHIKNRNRPDLSLERHYCNSRYFEQRLIERRLADRLDQMLANTYTADPFRTSFMDLPAEMRNMIYNFIIFSPEFSGVWKISTAARGKGAEPSSPTHEQDS